VSSACASAPPYGYVKIPNFGFEYVQTIDGSTLTKRQVGSAPLIVRCREPA